MKGRKPTMLAERGGMEGPLLPQGSGDGQSPEDLQAQEAYDARMWRFEVLVTSSRAVQRKRRAFSDYTDKNCEEAYGGR